jgi:hypothetical protein
MVAKLRPSSGKLQSATIWSTGQSMQKRTEHRESGKLVLMQHPTRMHHPSLLGSNGDSWSNSTHGHKSESDVSIAPEVRDSQWAHILRPKAMSPSGMLSSARCCSSLSMRLLISDDSSWLSSCTPPSAKRWTLLALSPLPHAMQTNASELQFRVCTRLLGMDR